MRNLIIIFIATATLFNSCQKEAIIPQSEIANLEENQSITIDNSKIIESDTIVTTNNQRMIEEMIFTKEGFLGDGEYYIVHISKRYLEEKSLCDFEATVHSGSGNPDLYLATFSQQRGYNIIDQSTYNGWDEIYTASNILPENESHLAFVVYAQEATDYDLEISEDCHGPIEAHFFSTSNGYSGNSIFHFGQDRPLATFQLEASGEALSGVKKITLLVNGEKVRDEFNAPYQWGPPVKENDLLLHNMFPGNYEFTLLAEANDGSTFEKKEIRNMGGTYQGEVPSDVVFYTVAERFEGVRNSSEIKQQYRANRSIYVRAGAHADSGIKQIDLYINNVLVGGETRAPYEWGRPNGNSQTALDNLSAGTYTLKAISFAHNGDSSVAEFDITISEF